MSVRSCCNAAHALGFLRGSCLLGKVGRSQQFGKCAWWSEMSTQAVQAPTAASPKKKLRSKLRRLSFACLFVLMLTTQVTILRVAMLRGEEVAKSNTSSPCPHQAFPAIPCTSPVPTLSTQRGAAQTKHGYDPQVRKACAAKPGSGRPHVTSSVRTLFRCDCAAIVSAAIACATSTRPAHRACPNNLETCLGCTAFARGLRASFEV